MYKNILIILTIGFIQLQAISQNNKICVDLIQTIDDGIAFNKYFGMMMVSSLYKKFPTYYKTQLNYKGLPNVNSIIISTLNTDNSKFKYDLFKDGYIKNYKSLKIDSLIEKLKPKQRQLNVAIFFNKQKQIILVDANNNKDFSDDESIVFDKNFRIEANDKETISKLPVYNFNFFSKNNNQLIEHKRKIVVYPHSNSIYSGSPSSDEFINKSRLLVKFKDFWKGEIIHDNQKYDIAVQGINPYLTILIKPDHLSFSKNNSDYNDNFAYKIKDTVNISNDLFIINSITTDNSSLFLRKIDKGHDYYSYRIGYKIADFELTNLEGDKFKISDIAQNSKKYTLLDFWSTWCKPCIELTPELKRINRDMPEINLIGIAYDKDIKKVRKYTISNKMNWINSFYDRVNRKEGIIIDLKITSYPTYILIDSNLKILHRGTGKKALSKIEEIIKQKSPKKDFGQ